MFHISRWKRPTIASASSLLRCLALRRADVAGHGRRQDHHRGDAFRSARASIPVMTTAYITRDHGYMVYDTLLATGFQFQDPAADGGR